MVQQSCSYTTVQFDDDSVADFFDQQVDHGLRPEQFGRIWIHTHPGDSASPSGTDEDTFSRVFGSSDWAVMFILACGGETYTRLRFNVGPQADLELPVGVDFTIPFAGTDADQWNDDYLANVKTLSDRPAEPTSFWPKKSASQQIGFSTDDDYEDADDADANDASADDWYEMMYYQMLEAEGEDFAYGY